MIDKKDVDEALDEAQMVADEAKDMELPEAPASMTLKVWIQGYGVMLTARDTKVSSLLKKTETMIDYAVSHGWKNRWDDPPMVGTTVLPQPTNPQAPSCGIHGTPMTWKTGVAKASGKPYAFWACNTKNANGTFCQFRPEKA